MDGPDLTREFSARRGRLCSVLQEQSLQYLVVSNLTNVFYVTGFRGSAGIGVCGLTETALFVDPRYTLQAREQAVGVSVLEQKSRLLRAAGNWLKKRGARAVGYDDAHLACAAYRELEGSVGSRCVLKPAAGLIEELRTVKDAAEIQAIRNAARLTSRVFNDIITLVRPGVSEQDLATEAEYRMRRLGAEGSAFDPIVASGPRSALPHARASSKLLKESELVILDLGAILAGYAADMTRTVFLGGPSGRVRRIYASVLDAQRQAIAAIRPGRPGGSIDAVARRVLGGAGWGRSFSHSTGHGVGLDIHELPRLARGVRSPLRPGNVVTVEPGVYVEGLGGVRIEDTVLVTDTGAEVLTSAAKDDWIIS